MFDIKGPEIKNNFIIFGKINIVLKDEQVLWINAITQCPIIALLVSKD